MFSFQYEQKNRNYYNLCLFGKCVIYVNLSQRVWKMYIVYLVYSKLCDDNAEQTQIYGGTYNS